MKIVIATGNKNKLKEIKNKFSIIEDLEILSLADFRDPPEVIEDGNTFEENAMKKAREISLFTGLPALSDDSGLVVDALDGKPGVFSARYGGIDSNDEQKSRLILEEMKGVPDNRRNARFVCVIAIAFGDEKIDTAEGICEGVIGHELKGENGFGYDPIFFLPEMNKTMAEISITEKNKISHRAKALDKAQKILQDFKGK